MSDKSFRDLLHTPKWAKKKRDNPVSARATEPSVTDQATSTPDNPVRSETGEPSLGQQATSTGDDTVMRDVDKGPSRKAKRFVDGTILVTQFTSKVAEVSGMLGPLKAACGILEFVLQSVKDTQAVNKEWSALIKKLKHHLNIIRSQTKHVKEDRDTDKYLNTPSDDHVVALLETYITKLEGIIEELQEDQPEKKAGLIRVVDAKSDKATIVDKIREMDEAFQVYTISLQDFVANIVKQTQDDLAQFRREFQDEAVKTEANRLKSSTVYGDQHKLCLEDTRLRTLETIHSWIADPDAIQKIFYLLDVPGSGKSTVSKTLTTDLESKGVLAGRFFFSRDTEETMSTKQFCSTLYNAFASDSPAFEDSAAEFKKRRDLENLPFEKQLEGLVIGPLKLVNQPAVLIVDAVDECNNAHQGRDRLLKALHAQHSSAPLLRIFITGRLEKDIKKFAETSVGYHTFRQLEGKNKDVERYIHSQLKDVLPEDKRQVVIDGAEDLFIWARISCDMLIDSDDPDGLLEELRKEVSLTDLYKIAMKQAMPKDAASRRAILTTLGMLLAAQRPLSVEELMAVSPKPAVVESVVSRLGSFLVYDGRTKPIRLVHITFRDFITSRLEAGQYFVQVKLGHYTLASQNLSILSDKTKLQYFRANELEKPLQREVIEISGM